MNNQDMDMIEDDQYQNNQYQEELELSKEKETIVIPLNEQLFQNLSWVTAFEFINDKTVKRELLGLVPVRSNLVWRYFLSLLQQRSNIMQHREKRVSEIKLLLEKLDQ